MIATIGCWITGTVVFGGVWLWGIWVGYQLGHVAGVNWGNKYPRSKLNGSHDTARAENQGDGKP